jgi:inosose dehydratase
MRLSYQTITWGGVVGHPVGVTSIKDLFYMANGSTEAALKDVAAAGYEGVEIFDGNLRQFEDDPGALKKMLADSGLELVAVYSGANFVFKEILEDEFWRIDKSASLAAEFGARHLVVGGGSQRYDGLHDDDYDLLAAGLDRVADVAEKYGLIASFHPHLTTIVEGPDQVDKILAKSKIGFCPDVAHLTAGGGDPAELIRRHADRVVYGHLKDFTAEPFAFLPLGKGTVDFAAVLEAFKASSIGEWITVELDEYDGPPIEAAKESKAYLASLGLG